MHRSPASALLALPLSLLLAAPPARAQDRQLTLEEIYASDPEERVEFGGDHPRGLEWLDDERYLMPDEADESLLVVDVGTGKASSFYDAEALAAALAELPGMDGETAQELAQPKSLQMNEDRTAALINHADDLFLVRFDGPSVRRLTHGPEPEVGEEFSPDGRFVGFVREQNLVLVDLASGRERALTADGGPELFYGRLDWVYQEEVYGRGNFKGYWWSPDSTRIAFLKLDESPVREFTVVDHIPVRLETEVTNYPKAGDPNPRVWLGVVPVLGGETLWVDTAKYEPIEHLIVRVDWTPDSSQVVFQVQNREQTWLDLNLANAESGDTRTLLRERTPAWVTPTDGPHWLADGSFLWLSEHTGFRHLYRYDADGQPAGALTEGEWEVRSLHGVDEEGGWVYVSTTEHSPIALDVQRLGLDGKERTRISSDEGSHSASFSPGFTHWLDTWSTMTSPPQVALRAADGTTVRVIWDDPLPELAEYALGTVERLQVPTRDGFQMEAVLIKPPGFDPGRRWPVLHYQYGGPHSPVVRDAWGGSRWMWHHMLAQKGYVIWMCDNRSASGKGIRPAWEAYRQLGVLELQDMLDGVEWLRAQPWVDPERIGVWGWSYGGFMTAYALTHSDVFKVGISGAPVTDWRLYDTIYTERYMGMPQNNPEGYDATSVLKAAGNLSGELLLIHGTMDDNVHLQNSIQLIWELQKAGKRFEFMAYPKSRHGVRAPELRYHLQRLMTEFVLEEL